MIYPVRKFCFEVGKIVVSLESESISFEIEERYSKFTCLKHNKFNQVTINVHYGFLPAIELGKCIHSFDDLATAYSTGDKFQVCLGKPIYKIAIFNHSFSEGEIFIDNSKYPNLPPPFPLDHLLGRFLLINILSQGTGVMLHTSAIESCGYGILFVGLSGSGKSTMSTLWKKAGRHVLCDDSAIIRRIDKDFNIFGTPWGSAELISTIPTKLNYIFFIQHAKFNTIKLLDKLSALVALYRHVFGTFCLSNASEFAFNFVADIVENIPCYTLGFVPNSDVISFINDYLKG